MNQQNITRQDIKYYDQFYCSYKGERRVDFYKSDLVWACCLYFVRVNIKYTNSFKAHRTYVDDMHFNV